MFLCYPCLKYNIDFYEHCCYWYFYWYPTMNELRKHNNSCNITAVKYSFSVLRFHKSAVWDDFDSARAHINLVFQAGVVTS